MNGLNKICEHVILDQTKMVEIAIDPKVPNIKQWLLVTPLLERLLSEQGESTIFNEWGNWWGICEGSFLENESFKKVAPTLLAA